MTAVSLVPGPETVDVKIQDLSPGDPFRFPSDVRLAGGWRYGHLIFANASRARVVIYNREYERQFTDKKGRVHTVIASGDAEQNLPLDMMVESLGEAEAKAGASKPSEGEPSAQEPEAEATRRPPMTAQAQAAVQDPKAAGIAARYNHQQKTLRAAMEAGNQAGVEAATKRINQLEEEAAVAGVELPEWDAPDAVVAQPGETDGKNDESTVPIPATPPAKALTQKQKAEIAAAQAKAKKAKSAGVEKGVAATATPKTKKEKKVRKTHDCICGCGQETGGLYAPGHDARVKGILLKIERGDLEKTAVPAGVAPFVRWFGKWKTEGFKLTAAPVKVPGRAEIENTTQTALEALDV